MTHSDPNAEPARAMKREEKVSPFILVSEDGEHREHLTGCTIHQAKVLAQRATETHNVAFHIYKRVAKTAFVKKAKVERA